MTFLLKRRQKRFSLYYLLIVVVLLAPSSSVWANTSDPILARHLAVDSAALVNIQSSDGLRELQNTMSRSLSHRESDRAIVGERRKVAICNRVSRRFRGSTSRIERINRRLEKKFGFTCSFDESTTRSQNTRSYANNAKQQENYRSSQSKYPAQRDGYRVRSNANVSKEIMKQMMKQNYFSGVSSLRKKGEKTRILRSGEFCGIMREQYNTFSDEEFLLLCISKVNGDVDALYDLGRLYVRLSTILDEKAKPAAHALFSVAAKVGHEKARQERDKLARQFTADERWQSNNLLYDALSIFGDSTETETQREDSRNAQRLADIHTLLNAFWLYAIDNQGIMPFDLAEGEEREICRVSGSECGDLLDVRDKLPESYLTSIPTDPLKDGGGIDTGYFVKHTGDRVTVRSALSEGGDQLSVTR